MRLKSFYAKTMTEAMHMVREALGEDAIILATREERGGPSRGGAVRVTAAIDPGDYDERAFDDTGFGTGDLGGPNFETHGRSAPPSADTWLQYDEEDEESAVAEEITDAMLRHAVPEDVMDQILSCATVVGFEQPGVALVAAMEHLFQFTPLPQGVTSKALMFVGPPGSGKTLAAAKAAARGVMNGLKVGVISTDTVRAGGLEQLAAFTKLLRTDLKAAESPEALAKAVAGFKGYDQIIIDTAGMNPFNTDDIRKLARLIGAAPIEPYLVLPGGMDAEECGEIGRVFSTIGAHTLVPSRVDMARRLGGLLSAAHHGGLSFADASNTPKVADGFVSLNPKNLSKLLMPGAYRNETARGQHQPALRRTGTHQ
ncbi:MAG TPA: GTPase [Alphaproteobacteria bacterium]|nr:GTPase [Alphaproteobacteria bacterium]